MDDFRLLVDLHLGGNRQGPGGTEETRTAIKLAGLTAKANLKIADIGCGTGASTLVLAEELAADVSAIDLMPEFLAKLDANASAAGLDHRITSIATSMESLPFAEASLDVIWSEGAIYNLGFEAGVAAWRQFLKPNGVLAVSELTWLTDQRPAELQAHWESEYAEVDTASNKIAVLERQGFSPLGYFPLPEHCWLDNYYRPLQQRFSDFLDRHENSEDARAIVAAEENEIALYERHKTFVGYGFYIARKVA